MNHSSTRAIRYATTCALALIIAFSLMAPTAEGQEKFKETYTAFAVSMGTSNPPLIPPGTRATLQINVTRWSTEEEREFVFTELLENGPEGFIEALRKQEETGWIRNTSPSAAGRRSTFPSERLRYSREFRENGKRRIILAMDRPIGFGEALYRPRWRDYDVTLVILDLDDEGKGEGQLAVGVKLEIDPDEKALVIESFASEPVRLTNVRLSK